MKKYFSIFIVVIFLLNLSLFHSTPASADNGKVVDTSVNSCKGYTNNSKIMWGKTALTYQDYNMFEYNFSYKIELTEALSI